VAVGLPQEVRRNPEVKRIYLGEAGGEAAQRAMEARA
jgi:hypothetical protein